MGLYGLSHNTPFIIASSCTDLIINQDRNDETHNTENSEYGNFPALKPIYDRQTQTHHKLEEARVPTLAISFQKTDVRKSLRSIIVDAFYLARNPKYEPATVKIFVTFKTLDDGQIRFFSFLNAQKNNCSPKYCKPYSCQAVLCVSTATGDCLARSYMRSLRIYVTKITKDRVSRIDYGKSFDCTYYDNETWKRVALFGACLVVVFWLRHVCCFGIHALCVPF